VQGHAAAQTISFAISARAGAFTLLHRLASRSSVPFSEAARMKTLVGDASFYFFTEMNKFVLQRLNKHNTYYYFNFTRIHTI
jgi:hypothetical protein